MRSKEISLWVDERWYDALSRRLKGETVEDKLNGYLDRLIDSLVPDHECSRISQEIWQEDQRTKQEMEDAKHISVFHVKESGQDRYLQVDRGLEFLDAARLLRSYLRGERGASSFEEMLYQAEEISHEAFEDMVSLRMENTGKVIGAFELDFDKREFYIVDPYSRNSGRSPAQRVRPEKEEQRNERALANGRSEGYEACDDADGWQTFAMDDISAAAYRAHRKDGLTDEQRWSRFLDRLDGRQLTSPGHLSTREIKLAEEICEVDNLLNFYMETGFDVDTVFGTKVCTAENGDWLNVYANYDMASGRVCDKLEIELHRGDGGEEPLTYQLNAAEKEVLLRKMEEYCQEQTGMSLADYSAQLMAEDIAPPNGPVIGL